MQTFKNLSFETVDAVKVKDQVWIAKKDVEKLLRDVTPFHVKEELAIEGQLYINAEDCLKLLRKSKWLGSAVLKQWFELNHEVMPDTIQQELFHIQQELFHPNKQEWFNFNQKMMSHTILEDNTSESLWQRFVVTGTLEEIRALAEMLRDKKLCHEEIAMILTMMRLREEKE